MFVNVTGSLAIGFIAALGPIKLWEQLLMIGLLGATRPFPHSAFKPSNWCTRADGPLRLPMPSAHSPCAWRGFGLGTLPGVFSRR
jgi:hypothetical protein